MPVGADDGAGIAASLGSLASGIARSFARLRPDEVLVLGDRYELLPVCTAALIMHIPILHISGGDKTEGAIDNEERNAVTQMASLHFPGTEASAKRIIAMGIPQERVFTVGEPGLENFLHLPSMTRTELAESLGRVPHFKWALFTYHPETRRSPERTLRTAQELLTLLLAMDDVQVIATYANPDEGGRAINVFLESMAADQGSHLRVLPSLGQVRYLSLMKESALVAGKSSSGIIEAPMLGVPVLNVGDRQKGRHLCDNVVQCESTIEAMRSAIQILYESGFPKTMLDAYYGDGHTADHVLKILKNDGLMQGSING